MIEKSSSKRSLQCFIIYLVTFTFLKCFLSLLLFWDDTFSTNHQASRKNQTCNLYFLLAHSLLISCYLAYIAPATLGWEYCPQGGQHWPTCSLGRPLLLVLASDLSLWMTLSVPTVHPVLILLPASLPSPPFFCKWTSPKVVDIASLSPCLRHFHVSNLDFINFTCSLTKHLQFAHFSYC